MVGTVMVSKKLLDRLRAAFRRYGRQTLDDPAIGVHFLPTDFEEFIEVLLTSPKFQNMGIIERQDSIWNFLRHDPEVTNEDLNFISRIATATEEVEFI